METELDKLIHSIRPEKTIEEYGKSIMAERGVYCFVRKEGYVKTGDKIYFLED